MAKHIVKFANTTNVSGATITEPANSPMALDRSGYTFMNTVIKINTLTGTSPTFTVSVRENFGGNYVETAKSGSITAAGTTGGYILCQEVAPSATVANNSGPFPAMGSGADKQVVTTVGGTQVVLDADIFFVFFDFQ